MTHELRTPLNGVIGTLDLMKQTTLESHQVEMVDLANDSASSLLAIVDDILDFSKIEAGRLGLEVLPLSPQALARFHVVAGPDGSREVRVACFRPNPERN